MKTNKAGIELIKKYEGFVPYIYFDCAGFLTIGYGHLCKEGDFYLRSKSLAEIKQLFRKDKQKAREITAISKLDAEIFLQKDLSIAEQGVFRLIKVPLTSNQFSALVSFTYNLGIGALQRSTLRQKLNRGEYFSVPYEMARWVFAGGIKQRGLVLRRREEGRLFSNQN